MAVTVSKPIRLARSVVVRVTMGVYPTGGEVVTLQQIGLTSIEAVLPSGAGGYVPQWDYTNGKLKVFQAVAASSALAEVPNSTDLSAITFRLLVVGR